MSVAMLVTALLAGPAIAADGDIPAAPERETVVVSGAREASQAGTKTDTPLIQMPQPITVISDDLYLAQGAMSVADTLRYAAGVQANSYGPDSRVDGSFIRGVSPLQFRDGMRDLFSFYASIRSDPYNFEQVEVVRGPASTLFGQSSIGGLINLVSKRPTFDDDASELSLRLGSFDRRELLGDVNHAFSDSLAGRLVLRARDAGTQTEFVDDDRVMVAPSLRWSPGAATDVTLLGLYQEDDGGSVAQFLPLVGTLYANPNGRLPNDRFIGQPGWDRYDGTLAQGTALVEHRFSDRVRLNLKVRTIDSDVTYFTHYPDNYSNPANPFLDANQRVMGRYSDASLADLAILSSDNNLLFTFGTGGFAEHRLLVGADYSWNRVTKQGGYGFDRIDIYAPTYASFDEPSLTDYRTRVSQRQVGFYLQDEMRLLDRASVVLGVRRDRLRTLSLGSSDIGRASATSARAGVIAEVLPGVSPFASYTESFAPVSGFASNGRPFVPTRGRQYEAGVKWHPADSTRVTLTGYSIAESERPVDDPSTPDPFDQRQAGRLFSSGVELEAMHRLPGDFDVIASWSYNRARLAGERQQLGNVPKQIASLWTTKTFATGGGESLQLGAGLRYSGANESGTVRTPSATLVDALATWNRGPWSLSVNATNLLGRSFYAACLARGDCFIGAERNVFGTATLRF